MDGPSAPSALLVIGGAIAAVALLVWYLSHWKESQRTAQVRKDAIRDGVLVETISLETKPMLGNQRLQDAEIAERRGDSDEAMKLVKELLEDEPKLASAWRLKSRLHWRLGELAEAELATQQADALRGTA